jgi:glucose/arabinose dehydrogenase
MRRAGIVLLAAAAVLSACNSNRKQADPTWEPSPPFGANAGEVPGGQLTPIVPRPSGNPGGSGAPSSPGPSGPSAPPGANRNPAVVAKHLTAPVGVALLPDGTALVGERTTGRIVRVQPQPDQPVPTVRTLRGLDPSGDGGLLDLAVSPRYLEDNLIYAYITTRRDNRVVEFTLTGPVTPVLTGIPKGRIDNTGRLLFAPNGDLYVGTGDGGRPARADRPANLAGKVLRISDIGKPARNNPIKGSPVYTSGMHLVDGLCGDPRGSTVLEVESGGPANPDEVNVLGAGQSYGWPAATGVGRSPVATPPDGFGGPGGCAVLDDQLWMTSLDGEAVLAAPLRGSGSQLEVGKFAPQLKGKYGRLKTVVAAPDGALWLTTSNKDGQGRPVPADERVIRYLPGGGGGGGNKT